MTTAPQLRRSGNAQTSSVAEHVAAAAAPLLGVSTDDVRAALSAEAAHIQLSAFADSTHAPVLVVAAAPSKTLTITLEARYADEFTSQVAFAKRAPASALSNRTEASPLLLTILILSYDGDDRGIRYDGDNGWMLETAVGLFESAVMHGWDDQRGGLVYLVEEDQDKVKYPIT